MPVVRYLEWFDHVTERRVGRIDLDLSLEELQELFDVPRENLMYDCCEVKPEHVQYLQQYSGQIIDLNRFAYFVSAKLA
jgi:hypothetical protein